MLEESIIKKLESLLKRSVEISEELSKEGVTDDISNFTILNREFSEIIPIVDLFKSLQQLEEELSGSREILDSGDTELIELAKNDISFGEEKIQFG